MRHWTRGFALCVLGVACGGPRGLPAGPPPEYEEPELASASSAAPPAPPPPASSEPTVRTDEQKARDAVLEGKAAPYVDAFLNSDAALARDGKRVVFVSTRDGLPQLYLGETGKPEASPVRLTTTTERVEAPVLSLDDKSVLYLSDQGGDEYFHIYRLPVAGGPPVDLTPGAEKLARGVPLLPRGRPDTLLFTAKKHSERATHLYSMRADGGDAKQVYVDEDNADAADVSPDGSHVLLRRWKSRSENVVLDVDTRTGSAKRIYPPEGKVAFADDAGYLAGGKHAVIATDDGTESTFLLEIDLATGGIVRRVAIDDPKGAGVVTLRVSPRGDLVALGTNEGNLMAVRVVDAKTFLLKQKAKLPTGSASLGGWRQDGRSFTVTLTSPEHPSDIFSVDAASGVATPLRADRRPGVQPMRAETDRVPTIDGGTIPVNVYFPGAEAAPPARKLPTIVLVHGGPATNAVLGWGPCLAASGELFCRPYAPFFVSLGYAIVEPNIRGSTGYGRSYEMADNRDKRGDALKDVESVNRWAKSQPWCDPERVVVFGSSYGGYMTLLALAKQPGLWRAGVDMFGPVNLRTLLLSTMAAIRAAFVTEFGDVDADKDLLDAWSPGKYVDSIVAPLFVYQGQNDPRVLRSESDGVVRALRQRRVPVEYMVAPDEGHTLERRANRLEFMARAARFLGDQMAVKYSGP